MTSKPKVQFYLKQYTNVDDNSVEHFDISRYWLDRQASLPRLAKHAIRTLDVPVTSADAERAFSSYKKLVCYSRLSLSDESARVLQSATWNGDITGRFEGYDHKRCSPNTKTLIQATQNFRVTVCVIVCCNWHHGLCAVLFSMRMRLVYYRPKKMCL